MLHDFDGAAWHDVAVALVVAVGVLVEGQQPPREQSLAHVQEFCILFQLQNKTLALLNQRVILQQVSLPLRLVFQNEFHFKCFAPELI